MPDIVVSTGIKTSTTTKSLFSRGWNPNFKHDKTWRTPHLPILNMVASFLPVRLLSSLRLREIFPPFLCMPPQCWNSSFPIVFSMKKNKTKHLLTPNSFLNIFMHSYTPNLQRNWGHSQRITKCPQRISSKSLVQTFFRGVASTVCHSQRYLCFLCSL